MDTFKQITRNATGFQYQFKVPLDVHELTQMNTFYRFMQVFVREIERIK